MMDFFLEAWVSSIIEGKKAAVDAGQGRTVAARRKLKLLFAGYNGTRNMGSDVRVEEMLRQIRHILGAGKRRPQHDDLQLRPLARIFRRHVAGASAGYFSAVSGE
jgi:hypothetical protein